MVCMVAISRRFLRREDDIVGFEKEASGRRLFYRLYGVQVVGGSNPLTPTLNFEILLADCFVASIRISLSCDIFCIMVPREITEL